MTKAPNGTMMPAANAKGTLATRECATVAKEAGEAEVEVLATTSDIRRAIWVEGNICALFPTLNTYMLQQTLTANIPVATNQTSAKRPVTPARNEKTAVDRATVQLSPQKKLPLKNGSRSAKSQC